MLVDVEELLVELTDVLVEEESEDEEKDVLLTVVVHEVNKIIGNIKCIFLFM